MPKNKPLDFNLDSLDENSKEFESEREQLQKFTQEKPTNEQASSSSPWKAILIGLAILGVIVWLFSDSSTDTSESNSSQGTTQVGQYRCSDEDTKIASSMEPPASEKTFIGTENTRLDTENNQLDILKSEIDSSIVTEYSSQYAINAYNQDIDSYNARLTRYKTDAANYNSRRSAYNSKVDSYNNFLSSHCK